jgi:TonB family protein
MMKNSVFWSMLGISVTLHGLVMIGVSGDGLRMPLSGQEDTIISTLNLIKIETLPPINAPDKPAVEKTIKPLPEISPVQETVHNEEAQEEDETQEINNDSENNEEIREGDGTQESSHDSGNHEPLQEGMTEENGTTTDHEYEALLAYIKEFIDKNIVYPPMARRRNIEGIVGVSFEIERTGGLAAITVAHSSGSSILDNAAVSLVKKMHPPENLSLNRTLALKVNIDYKLTE